MPALTKDHKGKKINTPNNDCVFPSHLNGYYHEENKGSYGPQFSEAYSEASHINNSIPKEEKDSGRANVSVMPLSTYLNLGLGKLAHTKLTIELADRIVKSPKGIVENILVGIGKFTILVDFIILDMPEDIKVSLILERPFLSIARAKIDVYKRKITLRVREERIIFKSVKPATSLIKRVYMLSLRERMEVDLEARLMGETLVLNRSLDPFFEDYIKLNDLNEPFELRRNQGDDLMPTIEEGEVIKEFKTRDDELDIKINDYPSYCDYDKKVHIDCAHNLKFSCMIGFEFMHANFFPLLHVNVMSKKFHISIMKDKMVYKGNNVVGALLNVLIFVGTFSVVTDFIVLENMDTYRDEGMGDVIFGEPFLREVQIKEKFNFIESVFPDINTACLVGVAGILTTLLQDLEWYEALRDSELKDEALRNKAIMEGLISDDESGKDYWKRWKSHESYYHDYDEREYENETHEEGHKICSIKTREVPVCQIKRYKMIKYSFKDEEEYVAVKEDEYNNLTITSEEACRAYQEIFRMINEGWEDHPLKHMEHRGIFDSGCSGHMTGNRAHLEDYQELSKVGSVTFGGSKGSISGKDNGTEFKNRIMLEFCGEKGIKLKGIGHRWMFDLDYLTDSMNYIPVSLQNQANPAGSKEVIDIDVQTEEAEELLVVSSTSRKAAVSENIAKKKTHSPKQPSSTPISKSADDIMAFRKELDALALKHLGPVPATAPTSTNPVNTGSDNLNTVFEEVTTGNIEDISPSDDHEEEVFSDADDDEMPEIRIYDKSSEGIFEQASYDDDGIITDFNNLPDEVDVSTNHTLRIHNAHPQSQILGDPNTPVQTRSSLKKITEAHALVSYIQAHQRSNHKDQQHCLFACFLSQFEPRKVSEALEDGSWVEAMQEELLQFKLQQVWVLVDLPNGAKVIGTKWVYRNKKDERGVVVRNKARLVAQGHRQEEGITMMSFCSCSKNKTISLIKADFKWSSMVKLTFFLGLQVKQNREASFISQDKYVAELLKKFDLGMSKQPTLLMETQLPLTKDEKLLIMCLLPFSVPWVNLHSFSDSDYGGSNLDRKSTTGGCQFLGQRLISWQCKKQTIVATSTTEAEYVAAANCCGQVLWVQNQLLDYGFNFMNTKIHIDNESTICIVKNPVYHSKTKHIEIRHHFIRDCYEKKLISVEKIHTDLNVADLLTKPFDGPRFNYLVVSIGMINP
ncbi:putative reverse transcriptase domain-containing protein [Tanacetum coccineum]